MSEDNKDLAIDALIICIALIAYGVAGLVLTGAI